MVNTSIDQSNSSFSNGSQAQVLTSTKTISLSLSLYLFLSVFSPISAQSTTWLGGDGNWDNDSNWSNGIPSFGVDGLLDNGNPLASSLTLDSFGSVDSLVIDLDDTLVLSGEIQTQGSVANHGLFEIEGSGQSDAKWLVWGNINLTGDGIVRLANSNSEIILSPGLGHTLTNVDSTIIGAGTIDTFFDGNGAGLFNQGSIASDNSSTPLILDASVDNTNGELRATGTSELHLTNETVVSGGTIIADPGSSVIIEDTISISDAQLVGDFRLDSDSNA